MQLTHRNAIADLIKSVEAEAEARKENEHRKTLLGMQVGAFFCVIISAIFVWFVEFWFPNFFNYPYFDFTPNAILYFTPLFIYAGVISIITALNRKSTSLDIENYTLGVLTGVFAGIWEELGFRWVYICTAMIGVAFANWLWGSVFAWIFILIFAFMFVAGLVLTIGGGSERPKGLIFLIFGGALCWGAYTLHMTIPDPIYWLYDNLFLPVINFVTFGGFESILLHGGAYPALFIYGAVSANAKFRDGHKYQGLYGTINSWVIGFVFLYATLNYGLFTAIALHCLYNFEIHTINFFGQKMDALTKS